jgi:transcriptional regulator with XRE-family HTH domain
MITREQMKAARALLDWSQKDLAEKSGVSEPTIKLIETAKIHSKPDTLQQIQEAIEVAGIEFLPQKGVRFRDDLLTVLEKDGEQDNIYLRLLDDMYYTLKGTHGEILHSFVDNSLSPPEVLAKERLLRADGINFRHLVRHGDTHLIYPLDEYRYLPKGSYLNNPVAVYGDKVAFNVISKTQKNETSIIIIRNQQIAEIKRREFQVLWDYGTTPQKTTAKGGRA